MSVDLLRRAWPNMKRGVALGCGAAFCGALALNILCFGYFMVQDLMNGSIALGDVVGWWIWPNPVWAFFLGGTVVCFLVAVVPGSLGGAAIGLTIHALASRAGSLTKWGIAIGCLTGGLAGAASVVAARLLLPEYLQFPAWDFAGLTVYPRLGYAEVVLLALGIGVVAGGGVGRRLASR